MSFPARSPCRMRFLRLVRCLVTACPLMLGSAASAQLGTVRSEQKIGEAFGGFGGALDQGDGYGSAVASLGDLDGDGIADLAVGAPGDDDGSLPFHQGGVWILFMNADGTVKAEQKISATAGGFGGDLDESSHFGSSLDVLGDLDDDGVVDLAVGADFDDLLGTVWILFLNSDGTVKAEQKIGEATGGFGGDLDYGDSFGGAVGRLGDLDGDGILDLAVGAGNDDDGGGGKGAVWILFLNADGTVKAEQKISATAGGFGGLLVQNALFGFSLAPLGDLDGDGTLDLAVGEHFGTDQKGALWILFLNPDGTVKAEQKINETNGGFGGTFGFNERFSSGVDALGDLDGDGVLDLAVGALGDADGGLERGALWILFLNADGTVKAEQKISSTTGGFEGDVANGDYFGCSVASLGDMDGNGVADLAVGAFGDNEGGVNDQGVVWILFLAGDEVCFTLDFETEDDLVTPLVNGQHVDVEFGALAGLTSAGPNAGLGIFDSTVGGPNDPSQDPDLLVGTGNVLILQTENLPPDGNDVFPRPNDDEDGGTITFDFAISVEAESLRLIDIDAGDGTSTVVLTDGSGRQRTYTVPSNWTGDLTLAQPGQGTLDLTTSLAQPGFGSSATATETAGFDPSEVIRLDVNLAGSGALDDLSFCSVNLPRASATLRNGSGVNPYLLTSASRPRLGAPWTADLDCHAFGQGLALFAVRSHSLQGQSSLFGEVLIGGVLLHGGVRSHPGSTAHFTWNVPADMALCGFQVHVQGLCQSGAASPSGSKTTRVRARLSNALDLVLGF